MVKNNSKKMYLTASEMFETGRQDQAITILENLIAQDPDYFLAYCSLGRTYIDKAEYQKAEDTLLHAIKLEPKVHFPHLYLGWLYEQQQELTQAVAAYERAVILNPDDFDSRAYLGYMYQKLDKQEAALKELQIAYQLNRDDITLIYYLIRCLLALNQTQDAFELLQKMLADTSKFDPHNVAFLYQLRGITFFNLGQFDDALLDIQRAIELNPTETQFYVDLGDTYYEKEQYEEAINSYNQALNSESESGEAFKGIGLSYLNLENWQATVDALEEAQALGEMVFFGLGFAYFELGDDEKGIDNFKQEILNDGSAKTEASYYLGFAYAVIGDHASSIETFRQFLELSVDQAEDPQWKEWREEAVEQIKKQSEGSHST